MTESRDASHVEEERGSSQPPAPSEQAKVQFFSGSSVKLVSYVNVSAFTLEPYYRDPDPEEPEYMDDMAEFYLEAARRLPIAQMPNLAGFLSSCGLLVGLNEPVTNIIVNAMHRMAEFGASNNVPQGTDPVRHAADRASYIAIARKSRAALVVFMTFYFRHLTQAQAKRYLRAARHDLALAVGLVELHRKGLDVQHLISDWPPVEQLGELFGDLHPDCARTKTALRYAAPAARLLHDPDDLMRLMASRYPKHLLDPVLDDLRRGEQLSLGRVNDILNLLQHPWSPPPQVPAPTPGTFHDADGNVTIIANIRQDLFSTTTITRDRSEAFNANRNGGDLVTTTTISRHHASGHGDDGGFRDTENLTTDPDKKIRLHAFLRNSTTAQQLQPDTNYLKMCLLDTINGLYIQALAMLPGDHQPRLLRAMLAAGHCYGVMENPVSNIVVNSIWYNARFPQTETAQEAQGAIRSMNRAHSSSLHGLIAIVRADRGITEQEAVACLCSNCRNLCHPMSTTKSLAAAAEAAKHPQPTALVEFFASLTREKLDRLRSLLTAKHTLTDADFKELNIIIAGNNVAAVPVQSLAAVSDPGQSALNTQPAAMVGGLRTPSAVPLFGTRSVVPPFGTPAAPVQTPVPDQLSWNLLTRVEEALLDYGRNTPLGPQYKLGVICGTAWKTWHCFKGATCYHVNFLASTTVASKAQHATTSPPECKLFFAEFWFNPYDADFEPSKKPPVCCPIEDYHAFPGRCFICEWAPVTVVHPPCGNYFMGDEFNTDSLFAVAQRDADLG